MDASPRQDPMPGPLTPMAATLSSLPDSDAEWGYEIKWDGVRAVTHVDSGRWTVRGRNRQDFTRQYPEVGELAATLAGHRLVLDGELVAFDDQGRPSFQRIQPRIHASPADADRQRRVAPVAYMIFDLLYLDGRSMLSWTYERRRQELERLELAGPSWLVPAYHRGSGSDLLEATRRQGLEGIVAKRLTSGYRPGTRTREWLKIKNSLRQEMVVGGWVPGRGHLTGLFGALLVGYHENGRLRYAGKVGTGFDAATRRRVQERLDALRSDTRPFDAGPEPPAAVWVRPSLVCEVEFSQWTDARTMRHPSFRGLRSDKAASEVVREQPS